MALAASMSTATPELVRVGLFTCGAVEGQAGLAVFDAHRQGVVAEALPISRSGVGTRMFGNDRRSAAKKPTKLPVAMNYRCPHDKQLQMSGSSSSFKPPA
jgi:hypothetical protein